MRLAQHLSSVVLTVALVAYAFDCAPMATAEQAMECCKSMRCMSHHHHGEDCCKTMPTSHVDVGQPTSVSIPFVHVTFSLAEPFIDSPSVTTSARLITDQSTLRQSLARPTSYLFVSDRLQVGSLRRRTGVHESHLLEDSLGIPNTIPQLLRTVGICCLAFCFIGDSTRCCT